jgi:AbrB family looped-hinge helix DNA binding protein
MTAKLSSKGGIVLPAKVRQELALSPGEELDIRVEHGEKTSRIVITKITPLCRKMKIVIDPVTKLPMAKGVPGTRKITSTMVKALLADFP